MQNVKQFISTIENNPLDGLTRGEHETCVLAANILRRCLKMGLSEDVWVGVEITDKETAKAMDLVLVGESSTSRHKTSIRILEFKQWSNVELITTDLGPEVAYKAVAWGNKPLYLSIKKIKISQIRLRDIVALFPITRLPFKREQQKVEKSENPEVVSLVFPNMR